MSNPSQERGEEFAKQFSDFVNSYSQDANKYAVEKMVRDHRTLQQNMMRFVMLFITEMAKNGTDLRNEDSVALAKKIVEHVGENPPLSRV